MTTCLGNANIQFMVKNDGFFLVEKDFDETKVLEAVRPHVWEEEENKRLNYVHGIEQIHAVVLGGFEKKLSSFEMKQVKLREQKNELQMGNKLKFLTINHHKYKNVLSELKAVATEISHLESLYGKAESVLLSNFAVRNLLEKIKLSENRLKQIETATTFEELGISMDEALNILRRAGEVVELRKNGQSYISMPDKFLTSKSIVSDLNEMQK